MADELEAKELLLRLRSTLVNVRAGLTDEGDRVYFGSTNDVDQLKEIIDEIDSYGWAVFMAEGGDFDDDPR